MKKNRLNVFIFLLLSIPVIFNVAQAQKFDKSKLDKFFDLIVANQQGMGSISIYRDGKMLYERQIGKENIADNTKASPLTKYRIGSISKMFTASIILQMTEDDKLSLEDKLSKYYPNLPNASQITIEQLLRHRSGLFNITNSPDFTTWMTKSKSHEEMLEIIKKNGVVFTPDQKAEYSNTNYVLLSYIAEKIDNLPFADILAKRIVKPLKLKNTYYPDGQAQPHEAISYTYLNGWQKAPSTHMSIPAGAGAVVSTPTDVNIFVQSLFGGKVISFSSLKKMKTIVDKYGMGLFQFPFYDRKSLGHTGGIDAFQSVVSYFEDDKVSVAYTSNGVRLSSNDILLGTLNIFYGKEYTFPNFQTIKVSPQSLNQYLGTYGSDTFPLKITISRNGDTLMGQATGQPSFPLEAYQEHKFKFDPARLKIHFHPEKNQLTLLQGGGKFLLEKE